MQLFELTVCDLPVSSKPFSSSTRKDLARSQGFATEVQFVHPLMGKMGGLTEDAPIEKAGRVYGFACFERRQDYLNR
jgi:hypothetical protein